MNKLHDRARKQNGISFEGLIPRKMNVTIEGRTQSYDLTPDETEQVLTARNDADEDVGARILGKRTRIAREKPFDPEEAREAMGKLVIAVERMVSEAAA